MAPALPLAGMTASRGRPWPGMTVVPRRAGRSPGSDGLAWPRARRQDGAAAGGPGSGGWCSSSSCSLLPSGAFGLPARVIAGMLWH